MSKKEAPSAKAALARVLDNIPGRPARQGRWTDEEIASIISAYRRGVAVDTIGKTMGLRTSQNLYNHIGVWCLRHCHCAGGAKWPEGEEPKA